MPDKIITYETIYEILRKEKHEPDIQKLSESFFQEVITYLKEKQAIVDTQKKQDSIFSNEIEKTEKQIINIKKILKELYEKRENKIIQLSLFNSRTNQSIDNSSLLPEEQELFNTLIKNLNLYRNGILSRLINTKLPKIIKPKDIKIKNDDSTTLIRFLHPVPKFLGEDLKVYGPFLDQDIANIPSRAAQVLLNKKRAQEIKS